MNDTLAHQKLTIDNFMSQPGNISDLAAYSGHSSLSVVGSEPEPDSSSRQEFAHHPPLPSDMGMRYMTLSATDDVRFSSDSGTSHSPGFSIDHQNSSSQPPNISFSPYPHSYQSTLSGPTYSGGSNPYYSPSPSVYSMPDTKPRLNSIHSSPGMAPPSRSPALPHPTSPISTRDLYAGGTPHLRRTDGIPRSPSTSGTVRGVPLSPSSSGFASPTNMDGSQLGGQLTPPLNATEVINTLQAQDGQIITPEIFAKIDKGFFMAESDWTCYRRNYFSLSCSFMLQPANPNGPIHLMLPGSQRPLINGFAMSIAAVVDARDGKAIELVQHTPKRDKGPQEKPPRVNLSPRPHAQHNMYSNDNGLGGGRSMYDGTFAQQPNQQNIEATFERIQFKNATANNGKRRAAQQYYHLLVELFANVGQGQQEQWVKIAVRMSAPMVVRGRSPGHYQSERRGSNASSGPGGAGGTGGGGSYTTSGGTSRTPGDINMSGTSSMLSGSNYSSTYDGRSHHYRSAPLQIPMEPTLSAEDAKGIENSNCYLYYPAPIWEGAEPRNQLPSLPEYVPGKIKQEYTSGGAYSLPSITGAQDTLGRHCGRWEGVPKSVGYFPTTALAQELNIS